MVPLATFNVHSTYINTVFRLRWIVILDDFIVEDQLINRDLVLTSIVLQGTSQESLCEEEFIDPIERRHAMVNPVSEELQSSNKVFHIST